MKLIGLIGTAVLSLTLAAPAYAQQEQHDQQEEKEKPAQEKEKKAQPEKPATQEERKAQEQKNTKPEEKNAQEAKPVEHAGGGRIPDDRYRANFGREHTFRVSEDDFRSHRFQYGGYWFGFVDPWPSNWLYTQNVYVIDIGGVYYLCNPVYPGVNVAISVTL